MAKLIVGCGYLGHRIAGRWLAAGDKVHAITRSQHRAQTLQTSGLQPIVADVTQPASLASLPRVDTVLYAVGFDRSAGPSMRDVYVVGLSNLLDSLPTTVERLIYISSTSVYGQQTGEWIDEDSACAPLTENGRICLEAERVIAEHRLASRACTLRLAGIYGPDRIPRRQALSSGEPITAQADAFLNLIHVDDAVGVVQAVASHPAPAARYVVADGQPVRRGDFYRELARLLGGPEPTFVPPADTGTTPERGITDKRISNRRLLNELSVRFSYPSYREGLAAILAGD